MTWTTWALFLAMDVVVCLVPGPAVLCVVAQGLRFGGRRSLWASAGILSSGLLYFALSATGLGALIATSHTLFAVIKWAGAAYLVFLGVQLWRTAGSNTLGQLPDGAGMAGAGWTLFRRGFIAEASNPKALVFFTALLPQFINLHRPIAAQVFILGITSVTVECIVLAGYGFLAGRATHLVRKPRFSRAADRVAGTLMIGAGAGLALASEHS